MEESHEMLKTNPNFIEIKSVEILTQNQVAQ
jgi:hypothetical protein